jgi:3-phosphoshikimate 1-carboxyvinyltransferase
MTLQMMQQFGIPPTTQDEPTPTPSRLIAIPRGTYQARSYAIEPDASNASYFLAAAALIDGASLTIEGLGKASLQGDIAFAELLRQMGAALTFGPNAITITGTGHLTGLDLDMNHIPDMVQTLAVVALFAQGPTTMRNVANLRVKETDRLAALQTELTKLGAHVTTTHDSITIVPPHSPRGTSIATYDDHRMAMAFAIAGLKIPGIEIQNPQCTQKTYPDFFADLAHAVS